jgi:hypothetical protein
MSYLDGLIDISELGQHKLVVLYGKSNSGKTEVGSTFPKPQLYVPIGDDGSNTIQGKSGIKAKRINNLQEAKGLLTELVKKQGAGFESVFLDTFSMVTNIWIDENAVQKNKKMTQQMWGDLKTETEELIRLAHKLADYCWVILSCHEATDVIEGMEDEITPDIRPSTTKGARTYLEGMANFGIHTTRLEKDVIKDGIEKTVVKYAAHIGANPYYWTKLQIDKNIKVPKLVINPTYDKLINIITGGN